MKCFDQFHSIWKKEWQDSFQVEIFTNIVESRPFNFLIRLIVDLCRKSWPLSFFKFELKAESCWQGAVLHGDFNVRNFLSGGEYREQIHLSRVWWEVIFPFSVLLCGLRLRKRLQLAGMAVGGGGWVPEWLIRQSSSHLSSLYISPSFSFLNNNKVGKPLLANRSVF